MFVVKPFEECMREDSVRLQPKMEELVQFTEAMEDFLWKNRIPYTYIDVLDLQSRVDIVTEKITEKLGPAPV